MPGEVELATAAIGLVQTGLGYIGKGKRTRETNALIAQRKAFETPDEIFDILNATQSKAANGLGAETLNYLTDQTSRSFSSALGTSALLGGNPNDLSALFDQNMQGLMKIGSANHAANLANFSQYLGALNTVAENKAAEQISADNLLKDQIQAKAAAAADANKNIQNGLNTAIGAGAAYSMGQLYKDKNKVDNSLLDIPLSVNRTPIETIPTTRPIFNPGITNR